MRKPTFESIGRYGEDSPLNFLNRSDERRLRAGAWRHIRMINPTKARELLKRHREHHQ